MLCSCFLAAMAHMYPACTAGQTMYTPPPYTPPTLKLEYPPSGMQSSCISSSTGMSAIRHIVERPCITSTGLSLENGHLSEVGV